MPAKVFYYAYDHQRPSGGQKDTYQHVDILNRNGIESYALHRQSGFRLDWFENNTRVISDASYAELSNPDLDYLVLPEDLGPKIASYPGRKVIFNKNLYHGFRALPWTVPYSAPYESPDVVAVFAVSAHNRDHLAYAFPNKPVFLVHYDLRVEMFEYCPLSLKQPVIACVPKAVAHLSSLWHILNARASVGANRLGECSWAVLRDMTEQTVAHTLKSALILVFLGLEEGLPRTPLEAMASGCIVVAYKHGPLAELLPAEFGFAHGDLLSAAQFIERVVEEYRVSEELKQLTIKARSMAQAYSKERQSHSVLSTWESIFALS